MGEIIKGPWPESLNSELRRVESSLGDPPRDLTEHPMQSHLDIAFLPSQSDIDAARNRHPSSARMTAKDNPEHLPE